jgi:molybdopterin-guanine dinucleotide biosynthesis protein A
MGSPKAALRFEGESLARRTARLLESATCPTVELGPGFSGLRRVPDAEPGQGPLAALAGGVEDLEAHGWRGPVVVVATDMPFVSGRLIAWLAEYPGCGSVVPTDGGRPQTLCARYGWADLEVAIALSRRGKRAMRDLLEGIEPAYPGPEEWMPAAGDPRVLTDVDTRDQLEAARAAAARRASMRTTDIPI